MPSKLDLVALKAATQGHTPERYYSQTTDDTYIIRDKKHHRKLAVLPDTGEDEDLANARLYAAAPALLAECEYQAQAIEELVATVDDMIVQRNKAEAENERLTAERDRLRGLLLRVTNLCSQFKFDAEEWQTVKDARAALAEGEGDETND